MEQVDLIGLLIEFINREESKWDNNIKYEKNTESITTSQLRV